MSNFIRLYIHQICFKIKATKMVLMIHFDGLKRCTLIDDRGYIMTDEYEFKFSSKYAVIIYLINFFIELPSNLSLLFAN